MNQVYLIVLFTLLFSSCRKGEVNSYKVSTVNNEKIIIDGYGQEGIWSSIEEVTAFTNPWNKKVSPKTSLRLAADTNFLYFFFESYDSEIIFSDSLETERTIEKGDRVELFFSKDRDMKSYFCFEIDPKGRVLSYSAAYYRQFDFQWEPPVGFKVSAQTTKDSYAVEGAIPLDFVKKLALDNQVYFGAYRAEFSRTEKSDIVENWLTWVNPHTKEPDFHVPVSLGKLIFSEF